MESNLVELLCKYLDKFLDEEDILSHVLLSLTCMADTGEFHFVKNYLFCDGIIFFCLVWLLKCQFILTPLILVEDFILYFFSITLLMMEITLQMKEETSLSQKILLHIWSLF